MKSVAWLSLCLGLVPLAAGQSTPPSGDSLEAIREEMRQLRVSVTEMSVQLAGARREIEAMRQELSGASDKNQLAAVAEEQQLLSAKVDDQYQTKVESGSKYRVRLSGLVLLNLFSTTGAVDNLDVPRTATARAPGDSNGSFAASMRQSSFSVALAGPQWRGARTSSEATVDFFGGFPSNPEGVTSGFARLRTAKVTLDWARTSVVAGQDQAFISPLSPTSLASTAYPALGSAGNLWAWTPQIRVEHRFAVSDVSSAAFQWGVLDPVTGELPAEYSRIPTAGERSRVPAVAARFGITRKTRQRTAAVGAGGYYSRQNWGFNRNTDAWAATADWDLPAGRWFSFSGEAYRGRAIGGLGGGAGSAFFSVSALLGSTSVMALDRAGGWAQWKFKPLDWLEFNAAFGEDYAFPSRRVQGSPSSRNASGFVNMIWQPRSNLLFSLEFRRLWTSGFYEPRQVANHVSLSSGIVF